MDVKWTTWLVMLLIVLCFFAIRFIRGSHFPNIVYITGFSISNWLMLTSWCGLLMDANSKHSMLVSEIRQEQQELQAAGLKVGNRFTKKPKPEHQGADTWSK